MNQLFLYIFLLLSCFTYGQANCDPNDFELLKSACSKSKLKEAEFVSYLTIVKKLESNKCLEYVQKNNGIEYIETGLTYLLGELCLIANSDESVEEYIKYLKRNSGSAEEQRSFSFEYLFKQNPERVLSFIKYDKELLDHLVWGFMNNRLYGENDPYQKEPNKAFTVYDKEPKRVLTTQTYKNIFYKTYPSLKNNNEFSKQIDYLLTTTYEGLKELYE